MVAVWNWTFQRTILMLPIKHWLQSSDASRTTLETDWMGEGRREGVWQILNMLQSPIKMLDNPLVSQALEPVMRNIADDIIAMATWGVGEPGGMSMVVSKNSWALHSGGLEFTQLHAPNSMREFSSHWTTYLCACSKNSIIWLVLSLKLQLKSSKHIW